VAAGEEVLRDTPTATIRQEFKHRRRHAPSTAARR
jgi:hypothetical protein